MIHRKKYWWSHRATTLEVIETKSMSKPWFGTPKEITNKNYVHHHDTFEQFMGKTMADINEIAQSNKVISITEHTEAEDRIGDDGRLVIVIFYDDNK